MLRRAALLTVFLLTAAFTGCPGCPPPSPTSTDAGSATCASVCAQAAALGCPAAKPTANGASCEEVCNNVQTSGILQWNLACRAHAASCAAMDSCEGTP